MYFVSLIKAVLVECRFQLRCRIDEKERVIKEIYLAEFHKEYLGYRLISGQRELHMQQAVRVGIDRTLQPMSLVIELDHGFVNHNVIGVGTVGGL